MSSSNPNSKPLSNISFDIFTKEEYESNCSNKPNIIDGCDGIKRLIAAITYYQKLNVVDNQNDQEIFRNFIMNVYGNNFLNDYNHLVHDHRNDLEEIYKELQDTKAIKCDEGIKNCQKSIRHNQENIMKKVIIMIIITKIKNVMFYFYFM